MNYQTDTRNRLLDAAESILSSKSADSITFREICTAAEVSNKYAVQYHFGDLNGIITSIFLRHTSFLEERRSELFGLCQKDAANLIAILNCLYRPICEIVDKNGRLTFARFLRGIIYFDFGSVRRRSTLDASPFTIFLVDCARELLTELDDCKFIQRMEIATVVFLTTVLDEPVEKSPSALDAAISEGLNLSEAILRAPLVPSNLASDVLGAPEADM